MVEKVVEVDVVDSSVVSGRVGMGERVAVKLAKRLTEKCVVFREI